MLGAMRMEWMSIGAKETHTDLDVRGLGLGVKGNSNEAWYHKTIFVSGRCFYDKETWKNFHLWKVIVSSKVKRAIPKQLNHLASIF